MIDELRTGTYQEVTRADHTKIGMSVLTPVLDGVKQGSIDPGEPSQLLGVQVVILSAGAVNKPYMRRIGDDHLMATAFDKAAYPGRLAASFKYDRGFRACREVLVELLSFGLDLFALTDFAFWTEKAYVTFLVTEIHADRERA